MPGTRRRADARRSRAAILDAAVRVLDARPDAGLEAIATAAGVTRQTVYAHFPSREKLLLAVADRIADEVAAAMDGVELDAGPAADALLRLLDAAGQTARRHSAVLKRIGNLPVEPQRDHDQHMPVADRIGRVIRRGQQTGEFDVEAPLPWLVAVVINLAHTASEEQDAGRISESEAEHAFHTSVLRILSAATADSDRRTPPRTSSRADHP